MLVSVLIRSNHHLSPLPPSQLKVSIGILIKLRARSDSSLKIQPKSTYQLQLSACQQSMQSTPQQQRSPPQPPPPTSSQIVPRSIQTPRRDTFCRKFWTLIGIFLAWACLLWYSWAVYWECTAPSLCLGSAATELRSARKGTCAWPYRLCWLGTFLVW